MTKNFLIKNEATNMNEVYAKTTIVISDPAYIDEDQLYSEISLVANDEAERKIEDVPQFLSIAGVTLDPKIVELDVDEISDLREVAADIEYEGASTWITAVKLFYAIKDGIFTLYYRPMKLIRDLSLVISPVGGHLQGNYSILEKENQYFKYEESHFTEVTSVDEFNKVSGYISKYRSVNGIEIKPNRWIRTPRQHNNIDDHTGDVTCVILPFQTFKRLMDSNPGRPSIILWNNIKETIYGGSNYIKHDVILSSDDVSSVGGDIKVPTYGGRFANLSHLCPPSCTGDLLSFRIVM